MLGFEVTLQESLSRNACFVFSSEIWSSAITHASTPFGTPSFFASSRDETLRRNRPFRFVISSTI
jgi:hypothetical protein